MIYVNKIENRITFKIKTGYYLELLTPDTIKLLESTKIKITNDEIHENGLHLEINEVALVHCNMLTTIIKKILESCTHMFLITHLVNY